MGREYEREREGKAWRVEERETMKEREGVVSEEREREIKRKIGRF